MGEGGQVMKEEFCFRSQDLFPVSGTRRRRWSSRGRRGWTATWSPTGPTRPRRSLPPRRPRQPRRPPPPSPGSPQVQPPVSPRPRLSPGGGRDQPLEPASRPRPPEPLEASSRPAGGSGKLSLSCYTSCHSCHIRDRNEGGQTFISPDGREFQVSVHI